MDFGLRYKNRSQTGMSLKDLARVKLRSQTGASITFALLIFLVCTVLSSVLFTAATVSSGRMSGITEADQRYYAVTSAAELLVNQFKEHPVVSLVEKVETTCTTTYEENGNIAKDDKGKDIKTETVSASVYVIADKNGSEIDEVSDLVDDGINSNNIDSLAYKNDTFQKDAVLRVYNYTQDSSTNPLNDKKLDLISSESADDLGVAINEELDENGEIIFTLYNKIGLAADGKGPKYTLELPFKADLSTTTRTKTEIVSMEPDTGTRYKVTTMKTDLSIITIEWTFDGIRVVGG